MDDILRMVADGRLSAEEAEPILAALDEAGQAAQGSSAPASGKAAEPSVASSTGRTIRVEVTDHGHVAVNLRLPASLGELGLDGIPGLSRASLDRIGAAVRGGTRGPVFEAIDDNGDGVRIVVE